LPEAWSKLWRPSKPSRFISFRYRIRSTRRHQLARWVFTVLGAVAELERSLIVERVKAGLRNAKAKGIRLGRPRVLPDARRIAALPEEGLYWAKIAERLGIGRGDSLPGCSGIPQKPLFQAVRNSRSTYLHGIPSNTTNVL
jgi:hypothetical protein